MNETFDNAETGRTAADLNMAAFAHWSAVLGPLTNYVGGLVIALVIWVVYRDRSAFVRQQALQALAYQLLALGITLLAWLGWAVLYVLSLVPWIFGPEPDMVPWTFWVGLGSMIIPCGISILVVLVAIWGGWRAHQGHDFRYPLIGRWVANKF